MAAEEIPLWLFADQLSPRAYGGAHAERPVLLVEAASALGRRRYHRQKLHLILSALRHAKQDLGDRATLIRADTYSEALRSYGRPVVVCEPTSFAAERFVGRLREEGRVAEVLPTPTFALSRTEFTEWAGERTRFRLEDFYRAQRRRFGVLLDGDEPAGGRWNFDTENREAPPRGADSLDVEPPYCPDEDAIDAGVRRDLDGMNLPTIGADGPRLFPVTPAEADAALRHFVDHRLALFGRYEDAMLGSDWAMAHSLLSVPLNLGVLHPLDAVAAAEQAYRDGSAPLAAVEGFIRQILGWREYIWHLYWHFGPEYLDSNSLDANTPLPDWWTDLDSEAVSAECLRSALAGVRDRGWAHHIQRLMVLGNFLLLAGIKPQEALRWFLEMYVDAHDWVMAANVLGMVLHADGGFMATKPYAAGSGYISRMSNYCAGCRYKPEEKTGPDACPFNYLYWDFYARHEKRFARNPRVGMALKTLAKKSPAERKAIAESAKKFFSVL